MAATIDTWLKKVKLIQAKTLSELETTVRDAPQPTSLYVATVSVVGTTTTE